MRLFNLIDGTLEIDEMAYMITPFRKLIDRDKSKDKDMATSELSYIYFMVDPRSDYVEIYKNEEMRHSKVKDSTYGIPEDWKPDAYVKAAMETWRDLTKDTFSQLLYDAEVAVQNTGDYLRNVNYEEKDDRGKQVHDVNKVVSALGKLPKMVEDLIETRKKVAKNLKEKSGAKGSTEKALFEDGL